MRSADGPLLMPGHEHFEFHCDSDRLVGVLYEPAGTARAALVTTGPLTSVKEQAAGAYAKALAERGYAALAFDHRTFGESEGSPRQFENPGAKVADIRAAVAALRVDPSLRTLPVVAVGSVHRRRLHGARGGGGEDIRGVRRCRWLLLRGDTASLKSGAPANRTWARRRAGLARDRHCRNDPRRRAGRRRCRNAAAGGVRVLRHARGAARNYVNAFAVQSFAYTTPFDAIGAARLIEVPTLIVHSENALAPTLARKFIAELRAPTETAWLTSSDRSTFTMIRC